MIIKRNSLKVRELPNDDEFLDPEPDSILDYSEEEELDKYYGTQGT